MVPQPQGVLDKSEKEQGFYEFLGKIAGYYGIKDKKRIKKASKAGWRTHNNFHMMLKSGMPYDQAVDYALAGKVVIKERKEDCPISVALLSHGYNIYDELASMKVFSKLEKMGARVFTSLQLSDEQLQDGLKALEQGLYWANEHEMTAAAGFYLKDARVDGIITISAFGCGPDSLMIERITRKAKRFDKPLLNLTIDEQTGEAGFITRLEAFVDMLYRQKRAKGVNIETKHLPNTNFIETVGVSE